MVSLSGMSGLLTVRVSLSFFHSETSSASSSIFQHRREKEKNTELWASAMPKCGRTIDWAIELVAVCLVYDFFFSNLTEAKICWHQENESSNSWWTMCVKRRVSRLVDICSVMFTWEYETQKKAARIYDEGSPSVSRNWCVLGTSMYYYKVNCRLLFTPVATQTRREITFSPLFRVKIKSDQQTSSATKYCIKWNIYCTRYTFFTTELRRLWALLDTLD